MPPRQVQDLDRRLADHEATAVQAVDRAFRSLRTRIGVPDLSRPLKRQQGLVAGFGIASSDCVDAGRTLLHAASYETAVCSRRELTSIGRHLGISDLADNVLGNLDGERPVILRHWLQLMEDVILDRFDSFQAQTTSQWHLAQRHDDDPEEGFGLRLWSDRPVRRQGRSGLGVLHTARSAVVGDFTNLLYGYVFEGRESTMVAADSA